MISRKFIRQHKRPLSLLTFCFLSFCLLLPAMAQNLSSASQPSSSKESKSVRHCGYTLHPRPVFFQSGPVMNFAFSVNRDDSTIFSTLKQESIEAFHDGNKLHINQDALQNLTKTPVTVMVLIDVSKSMRRQEFRKLDALKDAFRGFIDSPHLKDGDRIAVAQFDSSMRTVQQATTNRQVLYNSVDRLSGRNGTMLYSAISQALDRASQEGAKALIVLSDGVDSSPQAVYYRSTNQQDQLLAFEDSKESDLIKKALNYNIRIFSVEMGNTSEAYPSMYVYRDSLANISRTTGGGEDHYIDLVALPQRDYYKSLRESLSGVLEQIRSAYKYDYLLPLSLGGYAQADGKIHTVTINFKFDQCILPVEIKYVWNPDEPLPKALETTVRMFLVPNSVAEGAGKDLSEITFIYLIMMMALGLLSGLPILGERLAEERGTRQIRRAIIKLGKGSPYIDKECPSEGRIRPFREGDSLLICPGCKLPHHLDCWNQARGRCHRRNCSLSSNPRPLPESLIKSYKLHTRS